MWEQFRKTLPLSQGLIVILVLVGVFVLRMSEPMLIVWIIVLEIGAIAGAWYGARLRKKIQANDDQLPLQR